MKAIRIMLCAVLSLVMALGMVGAYAQPLVDGGVTLRNVVITLDGEEYALAQQARILTNVDEDSAALRFELINGDQVLLPITGEIDETGVRFALDDSGRVYSVDMAMLLEMMQLDAETLAVLQLAVEFIESGAAAMDALADPANAEALGQVVDAMASALVGAPAQEVEMDINGTAYTGIQYAGGVSVNSSIASLDISANSGIAALDAFVKQFLNIFTMSMGVEVASFADLKAMMLEAGITEEELAEEQMNFEMTIGGDEEVSCVRAEYTLFAEQAVIGIEEIVTADSIDILLTVAAGDSEEEMMEMGVSASAMLTDGEITEIDMLADCYAANVYAYDDGYVDSTAVGISYAVNGYQENGLWTETMDAAFVNEYSYGYEDDMDVYTEEVGVSAEMTEALEADGSITTSVVAAAIYGDQEYGLSFDLNRAEGSGLTALVGENTTVYTLTENTEDVAYTLLSSDAMGLMADVMALSADETILALSEKISDMFLMTYDEEYYDEYYYEDEYYTGDDVAEEIAYTTVYSMEEAADIYTGAMPAFTAPAGYELSYIDVSPTDMYAEYLDADYNYIAFYLMDFGMDMSEVGEDIAYYDDGEGNIVCAEFVKGTSYVSFYFDGIAQEAVDAVLAGFSI